MTDTESFQLPNMEVAAFPRERFLAFCSRLKVQSKDFGLTPFRLLGGQWYILDELCEGISRGITTFIILKPRQIGATTFFIALDMFWAFEHPGLLGTFILHKEEARDDWRAAIEVFYDEIPSRVTIGGKTVRFKPGMLRHNRNILSFVNGSRFRYLIAGTGENRKGGLGRSGATNYVHGTEAAFYGNEDDIAAFKSSTSSMYAHRLQIWESTANGFNHFSDTYESAKESNLVKAIFVGWWRDERYSFPTNHPFYHDVMPNPTLTPIERQRIRDVKKLYGFDISLQQMAWYRWKKREEFADDQNLMDQEFPFTDEHAFVATGSKYFTGESLTAAIKVARKVRFQGYRYRLSNRWEDTEVIPYANLAAELRIWEHSSKFGYYCIGCDPAWGSSEKADRTVISVWRAYAECMVQAAEFCTPQVSTYQCAWVLAHLAGFYGQVDCRVCIEINGAGTAVWQALQDLARKTREMKSDDENSHLRNVFKNMREFFYNKPDSLGGGEFAYHFVMSDARKRTLMAQVKDSFELNYMQVRSIPMIQEMQRMISDDGHISAEGAYKDDRVMAAALAHEAWRRWLQPVLRARKMTRAHAEATEAAGGEQPVDQLVINFMKKQNIAVGAPTSIVRPR
jgi:hypothetical protein